MIKKVVDVVSHMNMVAKHEMGAIVYTKQPEGCLVPSKESKACRLIKSLYG